jgi:hypothetical protein
MAYRFLSASFRSEWLCQALEFAFKLSSSGPAYLCTWQLGKMLKRCSNVFTGHQLGASYVSTRGDVSSPGDAAVEAGACQD